MILNLNDPRILNLKKGQFAIPNLNWNEDLQELGGYLFKIKNRVTAMRNNGYAHIIDNYFNEDPTTPNEIEPIITQLLHDINIDDSTRLEHVYHLIQLWGGNSYFLYYSKDVSDFNIENYRQLVNVIINENESFDTIVSATKTFCDNTDGINISFITKHLRFWQKAFDFDNPLPIYDMVMAKYTMGNDKTNNEWKDLKIYWQNMLNTSEQIKKENQIEKFSTWELERQLFIFFQNRPEDNGWSRYIETKSKESTKKSINKKEKNKTKELEEISGPFHLDKTPKSYYALRIKPNVSRKVGYIDDKGWLNVQEDLINLDKLNNLNWKNGNTKSGPEKYKVKFESREKCIKILIEKGLLES